MPPRKSTSKRKPSKADIKAKADRAEGKPSTSPEDYDPLDVKEAIDAELDDLEELPGGVTLKRRRGRPIYKYNPQYVIVAQAMVRKGCTTFEIAEAFGVSDRTIWKWRATYEDFDAAFAELGQLYDNRVERTLAERAVGYHYLAEKPAQFQGQPVVIQYTAYMPPDIGAIKMWLSARQPDKWRVKDEVEISGSFLDIWQAVSDRKGNKKE